MKELYFFDETFYWGRSGRRFLVKTTNKYKHLCKNIHEKDDELGARRHPTNGAYHGLLRHNIRLDSM